MIDSLLLYPEGFRTLKGIKEEARKRHPDCTGPSGYLAFMPFRVLLAVDGTLKTHRLRRFRQVQRLFPSPAAMLSGTERVKQLEN